MKSSVDRQQASLFSYVPLRLTDEERSLLAVLERALEVCEYTDVVDVTFSYTRRSKVSRILESLVDVLSISFGLVIASDLSTGEQLFQGKSLNECVPLFRNLFEIGRRYKIMNPSKMRDTYGKLMYIIMDTESTAIKSDLNLNFVKPIMTVKSLLEKRLSKDKKKLEELFSDPLWITATKSIVNDGNSSEIDDENGNEKLKKIRKKSTKELADEVEEKRVAAEQLISKYTCAYLSESDIKRAIDSISDRNAFVSFNITPVQRMLNILIDSFDMNEECEPFTLSLISSRYSSSIKDISNGRSDIDNSIFSFGSIKDTFTYVVGYGSEILTGSNILGHDHKTQYKYLYQTFTLWKEIMRNMTKLWLLADLDMLSEQYRLVDTGQGYQRLQHSPRIRKEMNDILANVQAKAGNWVGLSVVHLEDRDVPNALVFIDKYTQVANILWPIVRCIDQLPSLVEDNVFHKYVYKEWGSIANLRMCILCDFLRYGFDGSGSDGGSCIDGRLTSAWNWCSQLQKKSFYYCFMYTGFQGFDGDFKSK